MSGTTQNKAGQAGVKLLASGISTLFNPLILVIPLFYVLSSRSPYRAAQLGIAVVFFSLIPFLILLLFKAIRRIETLEIPNQHNRHLPFLFGIASSVAGYIVLGFVFGASGIVQAAGFALVCSSVVAALTNLKWKISIHCIAIAMASVFMLKFVWPSYSGWLFITSIALAILICAGMMWSRVTLGAHTLPQTIAGILFGLLMSLAILSIYPI